MQQSPIRRMPTKDEPKVTFSSVVFFVSKFSFSVASEGLFLFFWTESTSLALFKSRRDSCREYSVPEVASRAMTVCPLVLGTIGSRGSWLNNSAESGESWTSASHGISRNRSNVESMTKESRASESLKSCLSRVSCMRGQCSWIWRLLGADFNSSRNSFHVFTFLVAPFSRSKILSWRTSIF